jgi:(2R)-3-sulfolactate dehydrogenase (NADP+)
MLALVKAVDLAVTKAKAQGGIATVGVHNTSTSSGQLAYYGKRAAAQGMIVIITANSPEFVAAKAGASATFGTNPLCFACPVEGALPFVFDMSTAAIALFGVLTCKATGTPLPEHSAYDAEGNWTTDVADIPVGGGGGGLEAISMLANAYCWLLLVSVG